MSLRMAQSARVVSCHLETDAEGRELGGNGVLKILSWSEKPLRGNLILLFVCMYVNMAGEPVWQSEANPLE